MATRKKAKVKSKTRAKRRPAPAAKPAARKKTAAPRKAAPARKKPPRKAPVRRAGRAKARPAAKPAAKPVAKPAAKPAPAPVSPRPPPAQRPPSGAPAQPHATWPPAAPAQAALPGERIGVVTHYYGHLSVAVIRLESGRLRVGDRIVVRGHTSDFTQRVDSLQVDHKPVMEVGPNDDFALKVVAHAREHDVVYKLAP